MHGRVPSVFMDKMTGVGISFTLLNLFCVDKELVAVSDTYQRVLGFIYHLKDVPVALHIMFATETGDPSYNPQPWVKGRRTHLHELSDLIREHGSDGVKHGMDIGFFDTEAGLPKLVTDLVDPPETCPLARAAPEGVYLVSLRLLFGNVWMSIRIHRKTGFLAAI